MERHTRKEDGRPADQWYWDDWFSSHDVQSCSFAAQGLWINMLGIMFSSEIRGTLTINLIQMDNKAIAKRFGKELVEVNRLITELEDSRVFDRLEDGTIISRRMFRKSQKKEQISEIRSIAGKRGMDSRWKEKDNKDYNKTLKIDNKGHNKGITKSTEVDDSKTYQIPITKITASSPTPTSSPTPKKEILTNLSSFMERWNTFAEKNNLTPIKLITSSRSMSLRSRLKEEEFNFDELLEKVGKSPHLIGENDRGWTATFDWILKPSNYIKIIEGQYLKRENLAGPKIPQPYALTGDEVAELTRRELRKGEK